MGTSLGDLTATTGLTKGAIYGNFADKDEVAMAAFDYNTEQVSERVKQHLRNAKSAKAKLYAYIDGYLQLFGDMMNNGGCPFLNAAADTDDLHPELFKKVRSRWQHWRNSVSTLVQEGIDSGEFKKNVDKEDFADLFIALLEGSVLLGKTLGDSKPFAANMQFLKKQVDQLIETG